MRVNERSRAGLRAAIARPASPVWHHVLRHSVAERHRSKFTLEYRATAIPVAALATSVGHLPVTNLPKGRCGMISNGPRRIASFGTTTLLLMCIAVPAVRAQQPKRPPARAAATASRTATIKYICFSTDPKQPVVYLSAIFGLPDAGSETNNFFDYEHAKIQFQIYLVATYDYPGAEDLVQCNYTSAAATASTVAATAADVAAKKQSVVAQATAANKRVIETGWKYTPGPGAVAAANAPGPQGGRQVAPQGAASPPANDASGPRFQWHMEQKTDALTNEVSTQPAAMKIVAGTDGKPQGFVVVHAYCSSNGVSVFFQANAGDKDPQPSFPWYDDSTRGDDEQVTDVRLLVDRRPVHVAQGFPEVDGHQEYTNTLGLLFYEPHTSERAVQDQQDRAATGIPALDGLVSAVVAQSAQSTVEGWQSSAAGPLSDLVSARSIRIELPVTTFDPKPVVDLNPQDPVLHHFVTDCNAKFTP
jgi:hypothetical protein